MLLIVISAASLLGQAPHFTRRVWGGSDGIPEPIVQVIAQDREGFLLVGTSGGLTRFDGSRFIPMLPDPQQESAAFPYYCLIVARDGSVWAGTEGEGLVHFWSTGSKQYGAESGLMDPFVRGIVQDAQGRIWAGTDNGLFILRGEHFERIDSEGPVAIAAMALDNQHRIWAGGSSLIVVDHDQVSHIKLPGVYSQNRVKSLLEAKDGTIWVGTVGGLLKQTKGTFRPVPGIDATVRTLWQTRDGVIWIGTIGEGIWSFADGTLKRLDRKGMLPSKTVLSIFEDASRRMWIGTQNGLVRLEPTSVEVIPLPNGEEADYGTISKAANGSSWMVVQNLFRVYGHSAAPVSLPGLPRTGLRNVLQARDGTLWVGTDGQGVFHIGPAGQVHHLLAPQDLTNNFVRVLMEDSDGTLWIGTDEGVTRTLPNGQHMNLTVADGLAQFSIRDLLNDRDKEVWIGTDKGLSHWRDGALVHDVATDQLHNEKIWSVLQDRQGTLWFATRDHGLFRFQKGKLARYTVAQGLVSNNIYKILQDRKGTFWLSGPDAIYSIPESALDGEFPTDSQVAATRYQIPFEADGAQVYGGRQSAGYVASDNTVWFPTNRGAAHVLSPDASDKPLPLVRIDSISPDGQRLAENGPVTLPARSIRLDIAFAPLMLGSQREVRFSYILEGFDHTWLPATTTRFARYTNLPAGRFRFRVVAFDASRPELKSEASIEITKDRHIYQTGWFRTACLVLVLVAILAGYRLHMRRIKAEFQATLKERGRIAREMHDTVIQGCNGVSVLLEAFASQQGPAAENNTLLRHARSQIIATVKEARDLVWNLRNEERIDLSGSLEQLALQASQALGVPVSFFSTASPGMVPNFAGHEVLMIAREALANSGSHGAPQSVQLGLFFAEDEWTLQVSDNGVGFETDSHHTSPRHYGLVGMRERAERIGGRLKVRSSPGHGTDVLLYISRKDLLRTSTMRPKRET